MTTRQAAAAYEYQHMKENAGKPYAVYNPHNKSVEELPVIYGFNAGGEHKPSHVYGSYLALAIAEDGTKLGYHHCSSEAYMPSDLDCVGKAEGYKHVEYQKHYPEGYRMEFVPSSDADSHEGFQAAYSKWRDNATKG